MGGVNSQMPKSEPKGVMPPAVECERLSNRHLPVVLTQITFPPLPRFSTGAEVDQSYTAAFAEELRHVYPLARQENQIQIVINEQGVQTAKGEPILRFADIENKWSVSLSKETLTLESFAYNGISDFCDRLSFVANVAKGHFKIDYQLRVGLRFVNELRHPQRQIYDSWWELLNHQVVGYNPSIAFEGKVLNLVNEVRVKRADGIMRMRRGFLEGTTVRRPDGKQPSDGHFYLIDLDYFDETPGPFQSDHSQQLRQYNAYLFRVFRWLISDKLFQELKK